MQCNAMHQQETADQQHQQRKPSDPNTLPSESCQCPAALLLAASIRTHWPRTMYISVCHGKVVTNTPILLWPALDICDCECSYYCAECQPRDCDCVNSHALHCRLWLCEFPCIADIGMLATQSHTGFDPQPTPGKSNKLQNQNPAIGNFAGCLQARCW